MWLVSAASNVRKVEKPEEKGVEKSRKLIVIF
jgi:hypothetical protein